MDLGKGNLTEGTACTSHRSMAYFGQPQTWGVGGKELWELRLDNWAGLRYSRKYTELEELL